MLKSRVLEVWLHDPPPVWQHLLSPVQDRGEECADFSLAQHLSSDLLFRKWDKNKLLIKCRALAALSRHLLEITGLLGSG